MQNDNKKKIYEFDFVKGILILLMVLFHIELIENTYPVLRNAIYSFHMSGFLIVSGYLANINKGTLPFIKGTMRILVPYIFFELIYVILKYLSGILGQRSHIEELGIKQLIDYLIFTPQGPYWYLHTLVICLTVYYFVMKKNKLSVNTSFVIIICIIYCFSLMFSGFHWSNALYFVVGAYIKSCKLKLEKTLSVSAVAIIPLIFLLYTPANYNTGSFPAFFITILVLGLLLGIYKYCTGWIKKIFIYIGNNTLVIVVFSPIFTVTSKIFLKYFLFDSSGIVFAIVTVTYVIIGSLLSARLCDLIGISRLLFYKKQIYIPVNYILYNNQISP